MIYLDLYAQDFPKSNDKYHLSIIHFILDAFLVQKSLQSCKMFFLGKKRIFFFFNNTLNILVWKILNDSAAQNNSSNQHVIQKVHFAVKHLNPCFLATSVQNKYLEVFFGKSCACIYKYTIEPLLNQNRVTFA